MLFIRLLVNSRILAAKFCGIKTYRDFQLFRESVPLFLCWSSSAIFILMHKVAQIWPMKSASSWPLCPLFIFSSLFEHFLTLWSKKIF